MLTTTTTTTGWTRIQCSSNCYCNFRSRL